MFDKRIQFGKGKNVPFNSSYFCHKILPKQIIFEQIDVTDKSPSCMQDDIPDKANINPQENKAIMNFPIITLYFNEKEFIWHYASIRYFHFTES